MKNNPKRNIMAMAGIVAGLAIMPVPSAFANGSNPGVFSPDENVFGMTYGDWSAAWWQWILSIPAQTNPLNDATGTNCAASQSSGPVFFLVGSFVGPVTRTCAVPVDKAIFFPIINAECSTAEPAPFYGDNEVQLRICAGGFGDALDVGSLKVTVDGKKMHSLNDHRAQSPVFNFTLPIDDLLGVDATAGSSVSDGYYVMIKPLKPGNHTIHFEGACSVGSPCEGYSQDVTYNLTVVAAN